MAVSNPNMSTWQPFTGTIPSAWGDEICVTIDDKLHMTETSSLQTIQGPLSFSNTSVMTFAGPFNNTSTNANAFTGPMDFNSTINSQLTATFQSDISLGGNFLNTATFSGAIDANSTGHFSGIVTFGGSIYFGSASSWYISSGGAGQLTRLTFTTIGSPYNSIEMGGSSNRIRFGSDERFVNGLNMAIRKWGFDEGTPNQIYNDDPSYFYQKIDFDGANDRITFYPEGDFDGNGARLVGNPSSNSYDPTFEPVYDNTGRLGTSINNWYAAYIEFMYDGDGTLGTFDEKDDLALIRGIKPWKKDGKIQRHPEDNYPYVDYNTIPDFLRGWKHGTKKAVRRKRLFDEKTQKDVWTEEELIVEDIDVRVKRKGIRSVNLAMFAIGGIKQLDIREEENFNTIMTAIEALNKKIDDLSRN